MANNVTRGPGHEPMQLCQALLSCECTCGRKEPGCSQGLEVCAIPIVTCLGPRGACLLPVLFLEQCMGEREEGKGPEGMKEDPRKVKQTLQSYVAPHPSFAS